MSNMLTFRVDKQTGVPAYVQLVLQIKQSMRRGELEPGDRLPTAKDVVKVLGINPNTVLKAYKELEHEGLVEGRPGLGTFVTSSLTKPGMAEQRQLREQLDAWVTHALAIGLDRSDLEALCTAVFDDRIAD